MLCMQKQLLCCFHKLPFKGKRSLINPNNPYSSSYYYYCGRRWRIDAMKEKKEDSESEEEYEIDTEKARKALQNLDQQLQSFSTKQISSPKLKASDVKLVRGEESVNVNMSMREKDVEEISVSFLAYTAVALVLFTIFYNFLFYTVIAPSIDGP